MMAAVGAVTNERSDRGQNHAEVTHAFCELPFTKLKVDPGGNVSMCCYQTSGSLGNLLTQSLEEIWNGAVASEIRASTAGGQLHSACIGWGGCPYIVQPRRARPIDGTAAWPSALEMDLPNTHCNIGGISPTPDTACFMCPRSADGFVRDEDRSLVLAQLLRPLVPGLTQLRIQGLAEPFWHGRVFAVLDQLGFPGYRAQCRVSTYTNGSLLSLPVRRRFFELCPNSALMFSLDAATPETYRRIRRLDFFKLIVANVAGAVRERSPGQSVAIANNLNLLNLHEGVQMVELARSLGVDWLEFNPTHDGATGRDDLSDVCVGPDTWEWFHEAQERIAERARELGVTTTFVRPLALGFGPQAEGA